MKFRKYTLLMLTAMLSLFGFSACQDDDDYSLDKFAIEIMTVVRTICVGIMVKSYGRLLPIVRVIISRKRELRSIIPCCLIPFRASVTE